MLKHLYKSELVIIITGASHIKMMLMNNKKLEILNVSDNHIGNEGVRHITEGIQSNNTLTQLNILKCDFTVEGIVTVLYKMYVIS